jgi:ureidoglycolate hydrolase
MIEKKVKSLNEKNFAPYGQVVAFPEGISIDPSAVHGWKVVANIPFSGEVEVGWLLLKQRPMDVTQMEHHLNTPEMIIPLDSPFMVPVAPANEAAAALPNPQQIEGFIVEPGQALVMDRSGWHWLPFPTKETGSCLIIFSKDTPAHDLLIKDLPDGEAVRLIV